MTRRRPSHKYPLQVRSCLIVRPVAVALWLHGAAQQPSEYSFEGVYHATEDSHIHRAQAAAVIYTVD